MPQRPEFCRGGHWTAEIRKVTSRKVAYVGALARNDAETLEDYFWRVPQLCPGRTGMIFGASPSLVFHK